MSMFEIDEAMLEWNNEVKLELELESHLFDYVNKK